jgi:4-amino-4-deoxy-L-arabinose transferase-like glycosyltransferase
LSRSKAQKQQPLVAEDDRYLSLLAVLCFAVAIVLRILFLRADPPWDFTWSQALFTDGARAIDGARNKVLFGQWIVDMRSPVVLFYPLINLLAYAIFTVGGVGLAQANLAGVLPALASIAGLFLWMRRREGRVASSIALLLFSFCYLHVVYSRVPMVESLLVLMLLAAFWLALGGKAGLFASGFLVGLASFMVKLHALHFVPVVLVYLALAGEEDLPARRFSLVLSFLGGVASGFLLWLVSVYFVNPSIVSKYFRSNIVLSQKSEYAGASLPQVITTRLGALIHIGSGKDAYFAKAPFMAIAGFIGLMCAVSGFGGARGGAKPWERLGVIWFVGLAAALSFLSYRPLRYIVLLTPSLVLVATSFLLRLIKGQSLLAGRKPSWFTYAFAVWLAWTVIHIQQDVIYRILTGGGAGISAGLSGWQVSLYRFHVSIWPKILIYGGASVAVTLALKRRLRSAKIVPGRRTRIVTLSIFIAGIVCFNSIGFIRYAADRKYSIADAATSLQRVLGDNVFLVGDCSTTISLETAFRTLPAYGDLIRYDERGAFEAYPITHFLVRFPTLFEYLKKNYPGFAEDLIPVIAFPLCGRDATVVRYTAWPGYPGVSYEPSDFEIAMGYMHQGRSAEACDRLGAFLGVTEDSHEALSMMAVCRFQMGEIENAKAAVERALELNGRAPAAHEIYGDILSSQGQHAQARLQWEKALKLNPNNRMLRSKVASRRH